MQSFEKENLYKLDDLNLKKARHYFDAYSVNDTEILQTIRYFYNENNYLIDPHTAVGLKASLLAREQGSIDNVPIVSLACAHPSKFPDTIHKSISFYPEIPKRLNKVLKKEENFKILDDNLLEIKNYITRKMRK